jgi:hypothetical protein
LVFASDSEIGIHNNFTHHNLRTDLKSKVNFLSKKVNYLADVII